MRYDRGEKCPQMPAPGLATVRQEGVCNVRLELGSVCSFIPRVFYKERRMNETNIRE